MWTNNIRDFDGMKLRTNSTPVLKAKNSMRTFLYNKNWEGSATTFCHPSRHAHTQRLQAFQSSVSAALLITMLLVSISQDPVRKNKTIPGASKIKFNTGNWWLWGNPNSPSAWTDTIPSTGGDRKNETMPSS